MKNRLYSILRAKFLIDQDAIKHWSFLLFLVMLAIIMIANTHSYEKKLFKIADLNKENKELRSVFADSRTELMKLKMESTISNKMKQKGIRPSEVPPTKIKVVQP
ncbi:MAG: FtsL-like putative cell division protein [Bacteroidota bacterium]|nr:FtsL-like putative cell division protein [Bacteroidota bacterium]